MPELTVSISENAHKTLITLAETSGETMPAVLDRAIENYHRSLFLTRANAAFAVLRQNETLWQEEVAERQLWDQTVADGVED